MSGNHKNTSSPGKHSTPNPTKQPTTPDPSHAQEQFLHIIEKGKNEWEKTVDAIDDIITILDKEMRIIRANKAAHHLFNYKIGELVGMKCHQAFYNEPEPCEDCPVLQTVENAAKHRFCKRFAQSNKTFDISGSPLLDEYGQLSMIVHIARDITTAMEQEEKSKKLTTAIEQTSEVIIVTDTKGTIQYTNPAFTQTTGYSNQEAVGSNIRILKSGKHDAAFYKQLWNQLMQGNVWKGQFINKRKDNTLYSDESTISPIIDADGKITSFVAVKRDVSKEKALEKQMQQAIKLEAIATLAGGIAHDFNNILSAMLGYAHIAKSHIGDNSSADYALDNILSSGDRAADLIKQILTFSRQEQSTGPYAPVKIQYILKEALKLIRASLPATIKIEQDIDNDCNAILADPGEMHQVIMNLLANAKEAINKNYGLIRVQLTQLDNEKSICLKITDNGCGMDSQAVKRIFDPFFTTHPKHYGTGLGMSVVHGIIKKHGGTINVHSQVDRGTTFTLLFPAIQTKENKAEPKTKQGPVKNEHILIVDDEPMLVNFLSFLLKRTGYRVTAFTESIQAVKHFRNNSDNFDLVITDLTMPDMTGVELTREILSLRPSLPVILTTGYSDGIHNGKAQRIGVREIMEKPLKKNDLIRTIRKVLDNG
ncbi:PAS domain S-box protein [Desulfogranum marinum]|uniref:hybrid sensor histidine kinase/response regulator n=1 Tax=Desulfogranum marinum TaxID=453220 RepID=UPI0029C8A3DA|nr:PAS domain S-box protein [Desulfogranum marinum]